MKKNFSDSEPVSSSLRRRPHAQKNELIRVLRWIALVTLFLFLVLTISYFITGLVLNAFISIIGIPPILIALLFLKRDSVLIPTSILVVTIIMLITALATFGNGLYDIGVLGFPVILIVAGLFLRERMIQGITILSIICLGWLALSIPLHLSSPSFGGLGYIQDFIIGSIIVLVAGNAVNRLTKNVYDNLQEAEQEIEARNAAEAEREALIKQLRLKNQELDRFAIRVSHDLKTPLITLAGFLGLLDKDIKADDRDRVVKDLTQINDSAKTMGKFVDELLDLSRVGRIINPPQNVAFEDIIQDALKATDGFLKQKQVQVEIEAIFPFVYVDRLRVVQVLQNLIVNGVKFMGDQKHPLVKIGYKEIDGEHIFSVSDNGMGISPENHEHIFELFSKLNPEMEGTGLGLGLVKKIIEVHHGRIWVESELGKGATFKFTLASPFEVHG